MLSQFARRTAGIAGLACLVATTHAGPTGLNAMPIADVLAHREALVGAEASGANFKKSSRWSWANVAEIGLFDQLEVGCDNDFGGAWGGNLKIKLLEEPSRGIYALSYGVNWAEGSSESYLVGRYDLKGLRLHTGWLSDGQDRWMIGVDFPLMGEWVGMADHISGKGGYTYLGLAGPLFGIPGLELALSAGVPNASQDSTEIIGSVSWGIRL